MRGKAAVQAVTRCAASVPRGRMGNGPCAYLAKNGDLCHLHARLEDAGKTVHRVTPKKRRTLTPGASHAPAR